ncbi:MAG TPA: nicotinate-nucleotide adenylyltransferase [Armatimonadota bacterium]|nr:nicotinate-nucleotide adenylyltransferase [Armatimonadota bacterium]
MLRLGLMGGTFDPLHWAHLVMAEEARIRFELEKVLFVPASQPPHKAGRQVSDAEHRYAMALLGTAANPAFEVSRMEIERPGPSYSVDTVRRLREAYAPDVEIRFILGADEALDIPNWHEAESLPGLVRFIAAPRPGFDLAELKARLPARFYSAIEFLPMTPMDISGTEIRARVASGRSIRYLVPDSVEAYIRKHRLYVEGNAP